MVGHALLDILIVLVAAKVAAELMERINVPAVVGEILAGILIGPSALDLVDNSDVLRVLAEIGVILLLLEVGSELELSELTAVGKASLSVAILGVALPFIGGVTFGQIIGMSGNEALFVGAAMTATSVGITARVLGDLKALTMVEARTVLGAAVADDVIGLVILTVVVRLTTSGSVSVAGVLWIVFVAVGFLAVTAVVGLRFVPGLFDWIARFSKSSGTLVALALAFTLAIAELAEVAKLAPIVGAFVAGLALGRSSASDRIRRELQPVGHLFIPVFFLSIGIEVDLEQFAKPSVLGIAAVLTVIAVLGKLAVRGGDVRIPGRSAARRAGHGAARRGRPHLRDDRVERSDHRRARLRRDPPRRAADHAADAARAAVAPRSTALGCRCGRRTASSQARRRLARGRSRPGIGRNRRARRDPAGGRRARSGARGRTHARRPAPPR